MGILRDDCLRSYKVDVETDSTIAASLRQDMAGLQEVLTGITNFMTGIAPAVQAGVMPIEAVKEIIMAITRRSKMGSAVEDALDKIKDPQQDQDPQAAQQAQLEHEKQMEAFKLNHDKQLEEMRLASESQIEAMKAQQKQQTEIILARIDAMTELKKAEMQPMEMINGIYRSNTNGTA